MEDVSKRGGNDKVTDGSYVSPPSADADTAFKNNFYHRTPDKRDLFELRNKLGDFGFSHDDVYKLSLKFAGILKAIDIKAKFDKILKSLHYIKNPDENRTLAIDVLVDEVTISEAIKKSHVKKSEKEIKETLKHHYWARNYLNELAKKYAGEKTPAEIIAKFKLMLADIPYLKDPTENIELAVSLLIDWSNHDKVAKKTRLVEFHNDLHKLFGKLPEELTVKLVNLFFGLKTPQQLFEQCHKLLEDLGYPIKQENYIFALNMILGKISKEEALVELRKRKNKEFVLQLSKEFSLSDKDKSTLVEEYCYGKGGTWFDEKFAHVVGGLNRYPACEKKNTFLALQVLLGQISEAKAFDISRIYKNTYFINEYGQQFSLSKDKVLKLISAYSKENSTSFLDRDILTVTKNFEDSDEIRNISIMLALRVLIGDISLEKAKALSGFHLAFSKFAISHNDIERIAAKYLDKRNPLEMVEAFQSILNGLSYVVSKEENYATAIEVLLEGSSEAFNRAVKQTQTIKEKTLFKEEIASYGWFGGYVSDITDKFFPHKTAGEIKLEFEKILNKLSDTHDRELFVDLALKMLLKKISVSEAITKAKTRIEISSAEWTKGFVKEIENGYLGIKNVGEIIKDFNSRFERFKFWRKDRQCHKFIIEKIMREINDNLSPQITLLAMKLLDVKIPLRNVDKICSFIESEYDGSLDTGMIFDRYIKIYSHLKNHNQATQETINEIRKKA